MADPSFIISAIGEKLVLDLSKNMTPELTRELGFAMRDIANDIPVEIIKRMKGYKPGKRQKSWPLMVRSGKLAQTVQGRKLGTSIDDLRVAISAGSSSVPYAGIQEYGGTIKPNKPGGRLRMPLQSILTAKGNVKGKYEIVERASGYQTAGGKPTWISGRAIMIMEGGKPRPIWALLTEAKIPPRLGIGKTIEKNGKYIRDRLLEAIDRAMPK